MADRDEERDHEARQAGRDPGRPAPPGDRARHRPRPRGRGLGVQDRTISTFSRGYQPAFAGISTFLKAPYLEDVKQVGGHDVAIVGAPTSSTSATSS